MTVRIDFLGCSHLFSDPIDIIQTTSLDHVLTCMARVEDYTQTGYYAVGYVAYEAAPAFNAQAQVRAQSTVPLVWFAIYTSPNLIQDEPVPTVRNTTVWKPNVDSEGYRQAIAAVKDQIKRGNTYQTNYTLRLNGKITTDPYLLYLQLKHAQRSEYCAYLDIGDHVILSVSPELFFHYKAGRLCTKPMKGTAARGITLAHDKVNRNHLFTEKNRAENMMIVDLLRNDLNQIACTGTVNVDPLFHAEKYPTVWQLTSTIQADIPKEKTLTEVFCALFPCGSITGAPKLRTMQLIAELETEPRGVYCGAIGMITPTGEAVFNVAIRTLIISKQTQEAQYGVGGGITWDSTAEEEYQEVIDKARILTDTPLPDALLETFLLEEGCYFLLDRHLDRLRASAEYFDFPYDEKAIRATLNAFSLSGARHKLKVRLLLNAQGHLHIESSALILKADPIPARLADHPIHCGNRFLYHKTTQRDCYPTVPEGQEYLLYNEQGQLTEFVHGNLAVCYKGEWRTPPIECGVLAGTYRAELIAEGKLKEAILYPEDLKQAEKIALINSVRQWQTIDWQES